MMNRVENHVEPIEIRGRAKKKSLSKGMLSSLEGAAQGIRVRISRFQCESDERDSIADKLTVRDDALNATLTALKEQIEELKGELTIYKVVLSHGMLAFGPKQYKMDVPKLEKFKGERSAKEVDNFLWVMG
ncbi:hypothetical protein J1N35_044058 [Gossypium stocksii]|uniref:Uncharacterized protein n=1 Tax=Gossypium stocksii TaxID=47602 RepID=A0A9D3U8I4_9ROSI|nr:hypothetical protein J1N35_044058 [Gossypium stocksii]